jgi:hypothetical protein
MGDSEVQRFDPVEVIVVQGVLGADAGGDRGAKVPGEGGHQGIQGGHARHLQRTTARLQRGAEILVHDGVEHHARRVLDLAQHAFELTARADQSVDMLDGQDGVEPGAHGLGHGVQRLARRIRHQVDVKVGGQRRHDGERMVDAWGQRRGHPGLRWGTRQTSPPNAKRLGRTAPSEAVPSRALT